MCRPFESPHSYVYSHCRSGGRSRCSVREEKFHLNAISGLNFLLVLMGKKHSGPSFESHNILYKLNLWKSEGNRIYSISGNCEITRIASENSVENVYKLISILLNFYKIHSHFCNMKLRL